MGSSRFTEESLIDVVALARRAGSAIMELYSESDRGVSWKKDNSPLTKADIASHNIIAEGLKTLAPDYPVLSEESRDMDYEERKNWETYWLVDPLDGTKEFLKRNGEFTVNIALVDKGAPVVGVVHVPALGLDYYSAVGVGAFKRTGDGEPTPIRVSDYRKGKLRVMVTRSHVTQELENFLGKLGDFESVSMGSSLKLCAVAEGSAHLYPRLGPTMEWDTSAAHCVVNMAGGQVTGLDGRALVYNKPNLLNPYFMVTGAPAYPWEGLVGK